MESEATAARFTGSVTAGRCGSGPCSAGLTAASTSGIRSSVAVPRLRSPAEVVRVLVCGP